MKKILLAATVIGAIAFTGVKFEVNNNSAEAEQVNGVYIFSDSRPVKEYKWLGAVKVKKVEWQGGTCYCDLSHSNMMLELTYLAKKEYKDSADGILYKGGITADVIKFKK